MIELFDDRASPVTYDPTPVPTQNGPLTNWVFALEVDLTIKGNGRDIAIDFSGGTILNSGSPQNTKNILKLIESGDKRYFKKMKHYAHERMAAHLPDDDICFIFHLDEKIDWQYSQIGAPISLANGNQYNSNTRDAFRVDRNGDNIPNISDVPGCRTAYFIVNGTKCWQETPTGSKFPFNLQVDLMYSDVTGFRRRLPIAIDPEIQWPGGTKPS